MPVFEYQCSCGIRFEGKAKMADFDKPKPCPDCGADSLRWLPEGVASVFNVQMDGTPNPQNTGVSDIDMIADRAIGTSARKGWKVAEVRVTDKLDYLEKTKANPKNLSLQPGGGYSVMTDEERGVHERARAINNLAMKHLIKKGN